MHHCLLALMHFLFPPDIKNTRLHIIDKHTTLKIQLNYSILNLTVMRNNNYFRTWMRSIFLLLLIAGSAQSFAQTTIATNLANNNGSSVVIGNLYNSNASGIIIQSIRCAPSTTGTQTFQLWTKPVAGPNMGAPGAVSAANGWTMQASQSVSTTADITNTGNACQQVMSGMNVLLNANTYYLFCISGSSGIRYSTVSGTCSFSGGGVTLNYCASNGYGGTLASPTNTPRGLVGSITFASALPCSGAPAPGNTESTAASACSGASFTLSLQNNTSGSGVTYQWESSPNGSSWTPISGATQSTRIQTQTAATYYHCLVTCSGNGTTASNSLLVGLSTGAPCLTYCASTATSTIDEEIFQVTVNGSSTPATWANNCNVGPGPGSVASLYSNFRTIAPLTTVTQGQTVVFQIRENECDQGTLYANGIGFWIDFNQNGSFSDAGEACYVSTTTSAATGPSPGGDKVINGTFDVPVGAVLGTTVMRFMTCEGIPAPIPCQAYTYGETEDWLITISASSPCSGTPAPGNTISSAPSACSGVNFTLSLQNATLGSGVTYVWESSPNGSTWTPIGGATNSTLLRSQTVATYYHCIVTCSGNGSGTSNTLLVGLNSFVDCYCSPTYTSGTSGCFYGVITNVSLNTLNHNPPCLSTAPYVFVNPAVGSATTQVIPGSTYTLSVTSGLYNGIGVWIDWNQSASYDVSEYYNISGNNNSSGVNWTGTATVTVPVGALTGLTGMRVSSAYYCCYPAPITSANACAAWTYGETEDYKITVVPLPATPSTPIEVGVPDCISGGNLDPNGTAPVGETWYWQSIPAGTSTATPASGLYNILANGTYYLRARNNTYFTWSTNSSSVIVSDFPAGPADPTTSAPAGNPACGAVTLVSSAATAGSTNYWQGTNATGTSTALQADDGSTNTPYAAPSDGTYYLRGRDNVSQCWSNPVSTAVTIWTVPTAPIVGASPSVVCPGTPTALSATAPSAPPSSYTVGTIAHSPETPTSTVTVLATGGVAVTPQTVASLDDGTWDNIALPAGFAFNYYGINPTTFSVSTNGFITLGPSGGAFCCSGQIIPTAGSPDRYIAFAHEDWLLTASGTIDYFTNGTAPFRKFVVRYTSVPRYGGTGAPSTGQIILNETTNTIDFMATSVTTAVGDFTTMGIENPAGTAGVVVSGRNSTDNWNSSNEGWRFSPVSSFGFLWSGNTAGNGGIASGNEVLPNTTANPSAATTYTMTITDPAHGCTNSSTVFVDVLATPPAPTGTNASTSCGAGTVSLSATTTGGALSWYDMPTGGTLLGTGSSLSVSVVSNDVTVYVEESNGTCAGPRTAVTAFYTAPPAINVTSDVSFVCAGGTNTGVGGNNNNTANLSATNGGGQYTSFSWMPGSLSGQTVAAATSA